MIFLIIAAAVVLLFAVYLFLVFPKRPTPAQRLSVENKLFCHRGFFDNGPGGLAENTLEAIEKGAALGFGSEFDIQLCRDGKLVVFHDDDLLRACGDGRNVADVDYAELKTLKLFETDTHIPLLADVLGMVGGRVPLVIEIKSAGFYKNEQNERTCAAARELLGGYNGEYSIESFDPRVVGWFKKNAPEVMRGQLAERADHMPGAKRLSAAAMGMLLLNFISRPNYVAYRIDDQGFSFKLARVLGALAVCWTCRDAGECERLLADGQAVIFEGFMPER